MSCARFFRKCRARRPGEMPDDLEFGDVELSDQQPKQHLIGAKAWLYFFAIWVNPFGRTSNESTEAKAAENYRQESKRIT